MKLKIIESGFEKFNGSFAFVDFVDGVSTEDVPYTQAMNISANIRVVDAETGKAIGVLDKGLELRGTPTSVQTTFKTQADLGITGKEPKPKKVEEKPKAPAMRKFTRKELEDIADKSGIAGIREISDKIGIKGTRIGSLIDDILAAQGGN